MSTCLWKFMCVENVYPGMWQQWFVQQAVAVGWAGKWGFKLQGESAGGASWKAARRCLREIQVGDWIVAALPGHRIGRIGQVVEKLVGDDDWNPLVPVNADLPHGEMGRRILVRWDLINSPDSRSLVVRLPEGMRFQGSESRRAISRVQSIELEDLQAVCADAQNWESLLTRFRYERSIAEYLAAFPHTLDDGLLPHPYERARERRVGDRKRIDVLLMNREHQPVIVECKQYQPTRDNIRQLKGYMKLLKKELGVLPRGVLVHGGSRVVSPDVLEESLKNPAVELVRYSVDVDFERSSA